MKHGKGLYLFSSGAKYEGEYKDDKKHGYGVFTSKNGNVTAG